MDWKFLFTSFEGRIGRKQFWLGAVVLVIAGMVVALLLSTLFGFGMFGAMNEMQIAMMPDVDTQMDMMMRTGWVNLLIFLIFLWPSAALSFKRRHDRGAAGTEIWVFYALEAVLLLLQVTGLAYSVYEIDGLAMAGPNLLTAILSFVLGIFGLYLLVVIGFLKGDTGPNAYGADPQENI